MLTTGGRELITIATLLWTPNEKSLSTSRAYDESWVDKLYRGFSRNLTKPFRMVCYSERQRTFAEPIECVATLPEKPGYGDCIRPFELNTPMILVGLDTIVTGNIDHLADYCLTGRYLALPRDPYKPSQACNGVCLVPAGHGWLWSDWDGQGSDMERCREAEHSYIDAIFPGQVVSYKGRARDKGIDDARLVYFHGDEKPHQQGMPAWVSENWR